MSAPPLAEHAYVETGLGEMHVVSLVPDQRRRTMVLIHQVPSSHLMWRAVMERLARSGTASVAVDLPGFGFSPHPAQPPSVQDYGRIVATALRSLLSEPCLIVGHHFGCIVAIEAANQELSRVRAVAGYGIPLLSEERRRALATEEIESLDPGGARVSGYWRTRRRRPGASDDVEHTRRSLTEWLLAGEYAVLGHRAVGAYDTGGALRRLRQPLLGLAGEEEGLYEETRRAAGVALRGRFQPLGSAGIDVADTHVDDLCDALIDFDDVTRGPQ